MALSGADCWSARRERTSALAAAVGAGWRTKQGPPKCFHVTPFQESFNAVCQSLREICKRHGWEYVRGDMGASQRIIYRIWHGICQASSVVIDVTGHSLNVGLELGLVHALGKPYRIIGRGEILAHRFPSIGKVDIHPYPEADPGQALANIVGPMLRPPPPR